MYFSLTTKFDSLKSIILNILLSLKGFLFSTGNQGSYSQGLDQTGQGRRSQVLWAGTPVLELKTINNLKVIPHREQVGATWKFGSNISFFLQISTIEDRQSSNSTLIGHGSPFAWEHLDKGAKQKKKWLCVSPCQCEHSWTLIDPKSCWIHFWGVSQYSHTGFLHNTDNLNL